jgi:lipopolysaccharide assembly outer membrane protein LptD (OstA)
VVEIQIAMKRNIAPPERRILTGGITAGLLVLALQAFAQDAPGALSAGHQDSAVAARDSVRVPRSSSGLDTVVTYAASDSIEYELVRRTMFLHGKASLQYKDLGLKAEEMDINWNTATLNARGVVDTSDSTGRHYRGLPQLMDGGETYDGSVVSYNFHTKRGKIDLGKTSIDRGRYTGEAIKKTEEKVLYVRDGRFTTCELDHPHFYFQSPTMRIKVQEEIVVRPVYLFIADVPVFALPFGVFPAHRGRHSGLLTPAFGESRRGRYLTNLGYYWAMNDYMDLKARSDVYSKGGYTLYADFRYALRYYFGGTLSASFGREISGEPGDPTYSDSRVYNIRMNHHQQIDPTSQLLVDLTFISGNYYQQTSTNWNDLLQQNIVSNATFTKSWEGSPASLTVNVRRDQNLYPQPGSVELTTVLPSVLFNLSQTYPFRSRKATGLSSQQWYEMIGVSYGGQFTNRQTRTLALDSRALDDKRWGAQHALSINASPKAGYITVAPFLNYRETWYGESVEKEVNPADSQLVTSTRHGFNAIRTFDMGVSASTKLYGMFRPGIFGITGIRHQVVPSLTYSFQPDFSDARFGYYGTYVDTAGKVQRYDKFEGSVFGGASSGKRQALSFSLGNVFEMKTAPTDTSQQEKKIQLLNVGLGLSYNFAADSLRLSDLSLDFRTNAAEILSLGGSARFNFYQFAIDPANPQRGHRINTFSAAAGGPLASLTAFSISVGTRFSGEKTKTSAGHERTAEDSARQVQRSRYAGLYEERDPDFSIPWNLDLTWNFSQSQQDPRYIYRSSTMGVRFGFNLTEMWKITASANYDLVRRAFSAPYITVYRDLHCWEINFSWVPTGANRNYRLEIRLKDPMLRDLKVTQQSSARGIY